VEPVPAHVKIKPVLGGYAGLAVARHLIFFQGEIPGKAQPEAVIAAVGGILPVDIAPAEGRLEGDVGAVGAVIFLEQVVIAARRLERGRQTGQEEAIAAHAGQIAAENIPARLKDDQEAGRIGPQVAPALAARLVAAAEVGVIIGELAVAGLVEVEPPAAAVACKVAFTSGGCSRK
jgi:hypothetical protein